MPLLIFRENKQRLQHRRCEPNYTVGGIKAAPIDEPFIFFRMLLAPIRKQTADQSQLDLIFHRSHVLPPQKEMTVP